MKIPARPKDNVWTRKDVLAHLESAVNLELWTIPYYMTVMYSIEDPSEPAFRLIRSVVYQEMLHAELAANVYNSFQPERPLTLGPFVYTLDGGVPHLDFALDPEAEAKFGKPDARLGPLDRPRINTMCLIELPESTPPPPNPDVEEYASIGDFYEAVREGMKQHTDEVRGNFRQVDFFRNFYNNLNRLTVTADGAAGLSQALELIEVITEQGEGRNKADEDIPPEFQNTADGYNPAWSHFLKFEAVRNRLLTGNAPAIYSAPDPDAVNSEPQLVLVKKFAKMLETLAKLFEGTEPPDFGADMATVGAAVLTCWRQGYVPQFTPVK